MAHICTTSKLLCGVVSILVLLVCGGSLAGWWVQKNSLTIFKNDTQFQQVFYKNNVQHCVEVLVDTIYLKNFSEAQLYCQFHQSMLWQVLEGKEEWNAVFDTLSQIDIGIWSEHKEFWLGGKIVGICPEGTFFCMQAEALKGKGLSVRWNSQVTATWSKASSVSTTRRQCMQTEETFSKSVGWISAVCDNKLGTICVKRTCL